MARFRVGIIGCGRPRGTEKATGSGQAHLHVAGYRASPDCEVVAAADISQENLDAFRREYSIPHGYLDYREMLARESLDIVSICTWPKLHMPMVLDAAEAGLKAIHCEKPMAPTWGEAKRMVTACAGRTQLTFNHQRRFGAPFRKAKALLDEGAIGDLSRIEAFATNLFDWGTHWFDMMFYYNNEEPVEWVIGQLDARKGRCIFGVQVEGQGLSYCRWRNGVSGLMITGPETLYQQHPADAPAALAANVSGVPGGTCGNRLIGTKGAIEVGVKNGPTVRLCSEATGGRWQAVEVGGGIHGRDHVVSAILDLVDALKAQREPELSARRALQATELIFATYESSRRRGRVELPLDVEDSPFLSMLESGAISVTG